MDLHSNLDLPSAVTPPTVEQRPALTPEAALVERALHGDGTAVVQVVHRLAAGDAGVARAVGDPRSADAGRMRTALLRFLALGTWQGHPLPRPAGPDLYAGRDGRRLREHIGHAVCLGPVTGWQASALAALRDPDPRPRQAAIAALAPCGYPEVLAALADAMGDHDEGVRWAAAIALARHDAGARAVLTRLTQHELTPEMRHVAAYVLRHLADTSLQQEVAPVVEALNSSDYRVAAPLAADAVLRALGARLAGG